MNRQIFNEFKINEEDFFLWCKENKKPRYKREVKQEFFKLIQDKKLIRNSDGKLVKQGD